MKNSNNDAIIILAEKIEETETAVVITYQGKRTIINNAAVMPICRKEQELTCSEYIFIIRKTFVIDKITFINLLSS